MHSACHIVPPLQLVQLDLLCGRRVEQATLVSPPSLPHPLTTMSIVLGMFATTAYRLTPTPHTSKQTISRLLYMCIPYGVGGGKNRRGRGERRTKGRIEGWKGGNQNDIPYPSEMMDIDSHAMKIHQCEINGVDYNSTRTENQNTEMCILL